MGCGNAQIGPRVRANRKGDEAGIIKGNVVSLARFQLPGLIPAKLPEPCFLQDGHAGLYSMIGRGSLADKMQQALRKDITATRERVKYEVSYRLVEGDTEVVKGESIAFVSYDILANPYSTTTAKKKTEENAAKIVANDIALRLGAYFHAYFKKGAVQ